MILAAPLVIPFAEALGLSVATLGMAKAADMVNEYIQENPEQSMKIFQMIMPAQGIANALKNKPSEDVEEVQESEIFMNKEKISLEDLDEMTDEEAADLPDEDKAELMKQAGKRKDRELSIATSEKLGLSGPGKEKIDIEREIDERVDPGGIQKEKKGYDFRDYIPKGAYKKRYADGGSIGIEVLFEPKRKDFNIGGQAQKTNTTPYDARASVQDYAAAMQKVGAGTDAQKLQAIGEYGLNQMQNSPSYFKAVGQGINQHMLNNQMLRDAFDAKRITEDQYKLMGGYDVAQLTPKIGLGNIKIGGTPGDVGIASALYNAIKAGGIGAEKLGIKEKDPFNQYGDIGFFGSIAKNYQGAKGLSESDKTLYESIISGKTQSDIDRFRSGLYAANQFDKKTGDRMFGGKIEKLFNEYKQSPSTFFYAGDDTQNMYDRFNKYYADGGRVGLFMGGDPLTGQALAIYNSMNAYGFSDQEIANALEGQGYYTPGSSTPETTAPNIINQQLQTGGGGDNNFGGQGIGAFGNLDPNTKKTMQVEVADGMGGVTIKEVDTYLDAGGLRKTLDNKNPVNAGIDVKPLAVSIFEALSGKKTDDEFDPAGKIYGTFNNPNYKDLSFFGKIKADYSRQKELKQLQKEFELQEKLKEQIKQEAIANANKPYSGPTFYNNQDTNTMGGSGGAISQDFQNTTASIDNYSSDVLRAKGGMVGYKDGGLVTMFKEKR